MSAEQASPAVALSDRDRSDFDEKGFVVVPGVLSVDQVAELRGFFEQLFDSKPVYDGDVQVKAAPEGRGGGVRHDIFSRYSELRFLMTHPPVLGALTSLLGRDFVWLPEMVAHDSRYGYWHKDTTPVERAGLRFHRAPEFRMVQCALYLQDNDEHGGGGLDVVPGSHREPDHTPPPPRVTLAGRVARRLGLSRPDGREPWSEEGAYSVPTKAEDMVIFNVLLNHQASQPGIRATSGMPPGPRKFAIFFVCGANNEHSRAYRDFIKNQYAHLRKGHRYPDEVRELARSCDLNLL